MCGICGYLAPNRIEDNCLQRMNDSMIHRGPDDHGIWNHQGERYAIGMAHRRLAIMDLSPLGHQPMFSGDGECVIVFNGEIYNFLELRAELEKLGHIFASKCDTEVILVAYEQWGDSFLEKLNGMFAIAIYDKRQDKLLLARDRIGKKPLYYYWDGQILLFGSELKPIMLFPGFAKDINVAVLARYLCTRYINEPDTIFVNTYKLEAGGCLIWHAGELTRRKYWNLVQKYGELSKDPVKNYVQAKKELETLLIDATARRMIADVPVGTFLSGGIDSSLISALAAEQSTSRIKTYCIGFDDKKYDEAQYAKQIAQYLGTDHTELYVSEKDVFRMMDHISTYYDEPFADPSQIATMLVSELARKDITVALSGDGGDELFCGYGLYDSLLTRQHTDVISGLAYYILKPFGLLERLPDNIQGVCLNRDPDYKVQFYLTKFEKLVYGLFRDEMLPIKNPIERELRNKNWQITGMLLDMCSYLPNEILTKVDRATMKYALEGRSPLLDYRVIEYSFRLPHSFKNRKGEKKYILKDILYDKVPRELLERPKQGFDVPIEKWMRGILRERLVDYSSVEYLRRQGIFRPEAMNRFILNYLNGTDETNRQIAWGYFIFQEWYREYA